MVDIFPDNRHIRQYPRGSSGVWNDEVTRKSLAMIEQDDVA